MRFSLPDGHEITLTSLPAGLGDPHRPEAAMFYLTGPSISYYGVHDPHQILAAGTTHLPIEEEVSFDLAMAVIGELVTMERPAINRDWQKALANSPLGIMVGHWFDYNQTEEWELCGTCGMPREDFTTCPNLDNHTVFVGTAKSA